MAGARGGGRDRALPARLLRDPELRGVGARPPGHDGGAVLGRRRHRPGHRRHHARGGRGGRQRHAGADRRAGAQMLGSPGDSSSRCSAPRSPTRQRRRRDAHPGDVRRGEGRVGPQRHQDLGDQRRAGRHPRRHRGGGPRAAHRGQASPSSRPRPRGRARARSSPSTAPRLAHRRGGPRHVRVPGSCLLGGKEKLDARLARARDGASSGGSADASMATFERTVRPSAPGGRHRARGVRDRARLREDPRAVGRRSSRTRRSRSRSST